MSEQREVDVLEKQIRSAKKLRLFILLLLLFLVVIAGFLIFYKGFNHFGGKEEGISLSRPSRMINNFFPIDLGGCENFTKTDKEFCMINVNAYSGNSSFCESYSFEGEGVSYDDGTNKLNFERKDYCFFRAAQEKRDKNLCDNIQADDAKEICLK